LLTFLMNTIIKYSINSYSFGISNTKEIKMEMNGYMYRLVDY